MTDPLFAVLVNLNRWPDTIECLESLLRSDVGNTRAIVVDNGSSDGSIERLERWAAGVEPPSPPASPRLRELSWPPVRKPIAHATVRLGEARALTPPTDFPTLTIVAAGRNLGFAAAINAGLRLVLESTPDGYAFLVNNDMVVARDALGRMLVRLDGDPRIAAAGGVILDYDAPDRVQSIGGGWMSKVWGKSKVFGAGLPRAEVRAPSDLGYVSGGCLLIRFETLRRIGLMDERFFLYGEDADWGERMRAAGLRLAVAPDALTWHKGSLTVVGRSPLQDYHIVRSSLRFVHKHAPPLAGFAWAYSFARFLAPKLVRGEWDRARAVLRAYRDAGR